MSDTAARDLADFAAKFRLEDLHLAHIGSWTLSLRPAQVTLGSMVLSVRSGTRDLAGLSAQEATDMARALGRAEDLAREHLGAVRLNLLCLMMQDPIVHFHILPRYGAPVDRAGRRWEDSAWPGPPDITAAVPVEEATLAALCAEMRAALT